MKEFKNFQQKNEGKVIDLLRLAYKSRSLKFGYDNLKKLKGKYFLILASDLSENTKRNIIKLDKFEIFTFKTKEELGKIFSKSNIGVVAVLENNLGLEIKRLLKGLGGLHIWS